MNCTFFYEANKLAEQRSAKKYSFYLSFSVIWWVLHLHLKRIKYSYLPLLRSFYFWYYIWLCPEMYNFPWTWAKYSNRILVRIIHFWSMFGMTWTTFFILIIRKFMNKIFVQCISLSCDILVCLKVHISSFL